MIRWMNEIGEAVYALYYNSLEAIYFITIESDHGF